jgi:hypothetical protein
MENDERVMKAGCTNRGMGVAEMVGNATVLTLWRSC